MAVEFDESWTEKQGLIGRDKSRLLNAVIGEFELRIGNKLVANLSKKQIAEFEKFSDEDARFDWLDVAYPTFEDDVEQISKEIDAEVTKAADKKKLIKSWLD